MYIVIITNHVCYSVLIIVTRPAKIDHTSAKNSQFIKPGVHRPACAWFLKIDPVWIVGMCVCPRLRLFITSGLIWTSYDWLNKFYICYMATLAIIVSGLALALIHVM